MTTIDSERLRAILAPSLRPARAFLKTRGRAANVSVVAHCLRGALYPVVSADDHLDAAMRWLCAAQDAIGTGGVSAYYDLSRGSWAPAYPETTGYIIPTFFDYAAYRGDVSYRQRALRMADWLLTLQLDDGAFPIGPLWPTWKRDPLVFDTGQIVHGLVRGFEETGKSEYLAAARRAGDWLIEIQNPDGSWARHDYLGFVHTYAARVAWGLLRLFQVTSDERYRQAGYSSLSWCRRQQTSDGWFANAAFRPEHDPLTHTIAYTIRGLLEGGLILGDDELVSAARFAADRVREQPERDGYLRGTFGPGWRSRVSWSCLTGDVQMGQIWLRLYELTGDESYLTAGRAANTYVKERQVRASGVVEVDGGIAGSYPLQGDYQSFQFVNWAAKFFVDSLMLEANLQKKSVESSVGLFVDGGLDRGVSAGNPSIQPAIHE